MRRVVLALAPLLLAGFCAPRGETPPEEVQRCNVLGLPATTTLQVGRAREPFTVLTSTDTLQIDLGFQGGQHVLVTARAYSPMDGGDRWEMELQVLDSDGQASITNFTGAAACPGGWTEVKNALIQVDSPDRTAGRVRVVGRLMSSSGVELDRGDFSSDVILRPVE